MLKLIFGIGLAVLSGFVFWVAIYQLFSNYLSALVIPRASPVPSWEWWLWVTIAIVFALARRPLLKTIGMSIASYRSKSRVSQRLLVVTGALSYATVFIGLMGLTYPLWGHLVGFPNSPWSRIEALFWLALLGLAEFCIKRLDPALVAELMPDADKLLKLDTRPPVVYLRAFDLELTSGTPGARLQNLLKKPKSYLRANSRISTSAPFWSSQRIALGTLSSRNPLDSQVAFATVMNAIGPYVAIGRPGEGEKEGGMDIGAAKRYVGDDEWQDVVKKWVHMASIVVIEVGPTPGLLWELSYVIQNVEKRRILLILPGDDRDYEQFSTLTASIFFESLPEKNSPSGLLIFDRDGKPLPLLPMTTLDVTLKPFFERLGLVIPDIIDLSEELRAYVSDRVVQEQFLGVSEYIDNLIKEEQARYCNS